MPGSSYPSRNDEMTSMLPNRYLGSGPQPHAGPAGAARPFDRDQQDAASPHPRSFQFEPSAEKTTHAPQKLLRTMAAAGNASAPRRRDTLLISINSSERPHHTRGPGHRARTVHR